MQRSKVIGKPPLLMSISVMLALREAVMAARKELNDDDDDEWIGFRCAGNAGAITLSA